MLLLELAVELSFVIVVWLLSSWYAPTARVSPSSEILSLLKRSDALLFEAFMYASCAHIFGPVVVVVSSSVDVVEEPLSLLLKQENMVRLKHKISKLNKTFFIVTKFPKWKYSGLCIRVLLLYHSFFFI